MGGEAWHIDEVMKYYSCFKRIKPYKVHSPQFLEGRPFAHKVVINTATWYSLNIMFHLNQ